MIETIFFETSMHQFAYFINWLALTLLWMVSIRIKDSSIIDIYWGFGFVLIAWACSFHNDVNFPKIASSDHSFKSKKTSIILTTDHFKFFAD